MSTQQRGKFDYLNFAYGLGAAIVIIGAMFKFLGWQYADTMFLVGLSTEAVIFVFSGIEFKSAKKKLEWENVFPQLNPKYKGNEQKIDLMATQELYFKNTQQLVQSMVTFGESMEKLTSVVDKMSTDMEGIGKSIDKIENASGKYIDGVGRSIDHIEKASGKYEEELSELSARMKSMNSFYNQMGLMKGAIDPKV